MSDSLQSHGLQHARPPCPSPSPRGCSNSCPLSGWCHPTISSSVVPFNLFQLQSLFQRVGSLHQVAKVLENLLEMQIFRSHIRPTESETQGLGRATWGLRSTPGDSDGVLVKLKQAFSTRVVLLANLSLRHLAMSDDLLGCPNLRWWWCVGDGQGGPACCSSWGCKESDDWATELNGRWECYCHLAVRGRRCGSTPYNVWGCPPCADEHLPRTHPPKASRALRLRDSALNPLGGTS